MSQLNIIDYRIGQQLTEVPFAALISAAMRKADTQNLQLLKVAYPEIFKELQERYNSGGGYLERDKNVDEERLCSIVNGYLKNIKGG